MICNISQGHGASIHCGRHHETGPAQNRIRNLLATTAPGEEKCIFSTIRHRAIKPESAAGFLTQNKVKVLPWPENSPGINPIKKPVGANNASSHNGSYCHQRSVD